MKKILKISGKINKIKEFIDILKAVALDWGITVIIKDED